MINNFSRFALFCLSCFILTFVISGCEPGDPGLAGSSQPQPIDPLFQEFYTYLDGEGEIGPALSPVIQQARLQCQPTRNGMLIYDPQAPASKRFQFVPHTGEAQASCSPQAEVFVQSDSNLPPAAPVTGGSPVDPSRLSLQVTEAFPVLAPGQSQEVYVRVSEGDLPLPSIEPDLTLTLPDGTPVGYRLAATGEDGLTRIRIDPIASGSETGILYQVCIPSPSQDRLCVRRGFLVQADGSRPAVVSAEIRTVTNLPFILRESTTPEE